MTLISSCFSILKSSDFKRTKLFLILSLLGIKNAYDCETCGQSFRYPTFLRAHRLKHTGENFFKCSHCGKILRSQHSLRVHEKGHVDRPFACEFCDTRCVNRHHLVSHRRIHENIPRLVCDVPGCDKSYARIRDYNNHKRIHEVIGFSKNI